jgi:DNA topoisomerase-2
MHVSISVPMWVFDKSAVNRVNSADAKLAYREVSYVPALYKIFDEILVNAADNKRRDHRQTYIKVSFDSEEGLITVQNDGKTVPVEIHQKEKIYIPHLIFGVLLTGNVPSCLRMQTFMTILTYN